MEPPNKKFRDSPCEWDDIQSSKAHPFVILIYILIFFVFELYMYCLMATGMKDNIEIK